MIMGKHGAVNGSQNTTLAKAEILKLWRPGNESIERESLI